MKKISIKTIFLFLTLVFIFYGMWIVLGPLKYVYAASKDIPQAIVEVQKYIKNNDYVSANIYIKQTNNNIAVIRDNLKHLKLISFIPGLNTKFRQVETVLDNAQAICSDSSKIIESLAQSGTVDSKSLLSNLDKYPQEIQNLIDNTDSLANNVALLTSLFKVKDNNSLTNIEFISKLLKVVEPLKDYLGEILGYRGQQRYLLLFQNNNELRPTGGFIGSYGILELSSGKLTNLFIDDIYHLDSRVIGKLNNEVPAPLKKYLKVKEWYLRDCNWNPDFSFSAQDCLNLYKVESADQKKIDGIITLTPDVVAKLFKIIGAQEVGGVLFESDNFTNDLQKAVELYYQERGATHWNRKDIIFSLANVIIDRFHDLSFDDYQRVFNLLLNGLESKDILLYSQNSNLQDKLSTLGWTGEIAKTKTDYLMVVDSNLASFKSDQYVDRTVHYQLDKNKDNDLIVTLSLEYAHHGNFSWNSTRYRTYTRVIVPLGSKLIKVIGAMDNDRSNKEGQVDIYSTKDKTVFGTFIAIEPKKTNKLVFQYKLPSYVSAQINNKKYDLYLQKQPGLKDIQYIFNVNFDENFSNYQVNLDKIISDSLSSFQGQFQLNKDSLINITW